MMMASARSSRNSSLSSSPLNSTVSTCTVDSLKTKIICKLCLELRPVNFRIQDCGCIFCKDCMQEYVRVLITEGLIASLTCPDPDCIPPGRIKASEIQDLVDPKVWARYRRLRLEHEVNTDPNRTWCPAAGCDTICQIWQNSKPMAVHCQKCQLEFCSSCKAIWKGHGGACEMNWWGQAGICSNGEPKIKRCPVCNVPIERDSGCAQMMCRRCKHVFCWHCLAPLDNDYMLRHYDSGPCKDKLGHSQASVFAHRLQVIALFAGFGLLVLVASPVLMLVVPCLACCKCKLCRKCNESDDEEDIDQSNFEYSRK